MEGLIILIDSREKKKVAIRQKFINLGVKTEIIRLNTGDYSFVYNGENYEDKFLIERKSGKTSNGGGYCELFGNLMSKDHIRLKSEFQRAVNVEKFILLIENAQKDDWRSVKNRGRKTKSDFKLVFDKFIENRNFERGELNNPEIEIIFIEENQREVIILGLIKKFLQLKY